MSRLFVVKTLSYSQNEKKKRQNLTVYIVQTFSFVILCLYYGQLRCAYVWWHLFTWRPFSFIKSKKKHHRLTFGMRWRWQNLIQNRFFLSADSNRLRLATLFTISVCFAYIRCVTDKNGKREKQSHNINIFLLLFSFLLRFIYIAKL